ncbi:MAG: response regulator, partial [Spirochaetota bacterium]
VISGDPSQVEQIILNLCVNAAHAMTIMRKPGEKPGGVLTVSIRHIHADSIFCSSHAEAFPGWYWMISHCDTGVGMDSDTMHKIFDPFFTTKEKESGTGLGLVMAYSIVHQHGGFIQVYSERETGSSFNVYFPENSHAEGNEDQQEPVSAEKGTGSILVIDDEEIIRLIAEKMLRECGYDVTLAENGKDGIRRYKEMSKKADVILLDMAMPGMSGNEVYRELKKFDPGVKVLLTSGFRQDGRVEEALKLGINGFIQKPYSLRELSQKIKDIIG